MVAIVTPTASALEVAGCETSTDDDANVGADSGCGGVGELAMVGAVTEAEAEAVAVAEAVLGAMCSCGSSGGGGS